MFEDHWKIMTWKRYAISEPDDVSFKVICNSWSREKYYHSNQNLWLKLKKKRQDQVWNATNELKIKRRWVAIEFNQNLACFFNYSFSFVAFSPFTQYITTINNNYNEYDNADDNNYNDNDNDHGDNDNAKNENDKIMMMVMLITVMRMMLIIIIIIIIMGLIMIYIYGYITVWFVFFVWNSLYNGVNYFPFPFPFQYS